MNAQDLQFFSQHLAVVLADNVGNRLTLALANGVMQQVHERCAPAAPSKAEPTEATAEPVSGPLVAPVK